MKVSTLQKIDRWVGVPLCWGLTGLRRIFGGKLPPGVFQPRKILFIKLAEQGSTVLAHPAILDAVEMVGRENVYFVVFQENRFILDALGVIPPENVITITNRGVVTMLLSGAKAWRRMRALKFDAAVDMEFFSRGSAAVTFASGAKARVGFQSYFGAGPYRGDLMTHRILYNPYLHTSQIFLQLVESLRQDPAGLPTFSVTPPETALELPPFPVKPGEREVVQKIVEETTGQSAPPTLLLLNPNASDLLPLRKWETARYVELAQRLLKKYPGVYVGMTGGPDEKETIERVARSVGSPRCVSFAGKTSLRQLLILYSFAEVLVTNDSGPAHFAALTPIHVVTLFGPETPRLFAARTPRSSPLWAGLACSPCVNAFNNRQTNCRNNLCMQVITVDQVFAEVCRVYEQRRAAVPA